MLQKDMNISEKKKSAICFISLGVYLALLLYIVLFSRKVVSDPQIFYPFSSYKSLFSGNLNSGLGILENILLFIPIGYFIKLIFKTNCLKTVLIGFGISLAIELTQLITSLGYFDFDDLLDNTLGALFGYLIYKIISLKITFNTKTAIKWALLSAVLTSVVIFSIVKISACASYQFQISFAAQGDNGDQKNILIMDCKDKSSEDKNINLSYQKDGFIHVTGISDKEEWIRIANITLEPGTYSCINESTEDYKGMAVLVNYYDENEEKYIYPTSYIMANSTAEFSLDVATQVNVYIVTFKDCNCDALIRPIIYKN